MKQDTESPRTSKIFTSKWKVSPGAIVSPSKCLARKTNGRGGSASPLGPFWDLGSKMRAYVSALAIRFPALGDYAGPARYLPGDTSRLTDRQRSAIGRVIELRFMGIASGAGLDGQGGVLGPELTKIGQRRAPNYLRQALLDPAKTRPKGVQGILQNGFTEYLPVSVVSRDGSETRGVRINEDSFTIQIRDANGKFYSFRKGEVTNVDKQLGRSMMPSYKDRLNAADTDDLIAYLYSLGGAK